MHDGWKYIFKLNIEQCIKMFPDVNHVSVAEKLENMMFHLLFDGKPFFFLRTILLESAYAEVMNLRANLKYYWNVIVFSSIWHVAFDILPINYSKNEFLFCLRVFGMKSATIPGIAFDLRDASALLRTSRIYVLFFNDCLWRLESNEKTTWTMLNNFSLWLPRLLLPFHPNQRQISSASRAYLHKNFFLSFSKPNLSLILSDSHSNPAFSSFI